jgi:hypothetical protein
MCSCFILITAMGTRIRLEILISWSMEPKVVPIHSWIEKVEML